MHSAKFEYFPRLRRTSAFWAFFQNVSPRFLFKETFIFSRRKSSPKYSLWGKEEIRIRNTTLNAIIQALFQKRLKLPLSHFCFKTTCFVIATSSMPTGHHSLFQIRKPTLFFGIVLAPFDFRRPGRNNCLLWVALYYATD